MQSNKKVLGIIPARLGSTRIPEKMLKEIAGKPLIQWTVERSKQARSLDALIVTTDSERIAAVVRPLGVPVIMTPSEIKTGTDRAAAAAKLFTEFTPDIVANIWGDEPLFSPEAIDKCVALLLEDEDLQVAVVGDHLTDAKMKEEPSIVKVLTDINNNVLFFTRAVVPFVHNGKAPAADYHVIGIMAMRRDFLFRFLELPQTPLELQEGVEQLRILEHGIRMRIVKGEYGNLGVNTLDELEKVRSIMTARLKGTM